MHCDYFFLYCHHKGHKASVLGVNKKSLKVKSKTFEIAIHTHTHILYAFFCIHAIK